MSVATKLSVKALVALCVRGLVVMQTVAPAAAIYFHLGFVTLILWHIDPDPLGMIKLN